jgi:response regulator RpfG family c-di-GMP phosphodiesterase
MADRLKITAGRGMGEAERHSVEVALLHDVGKIGLPHAILWKPGRLSARVSGGPRRERQEQSQRHGSDSDGRS